MTMKNKRLLLSFIWYCIQHPHERFWQSLRNWSSYNYLLGVPPGYIPTDGEYVDLYYCEDR